MLRVNTCGSPFAKLAVLCNLAVVFFGFGVVAADEVPVVLYETDHLGFGEDPYNVGLFGSYGIDVAIDGDALMVADNILSEDFGSITSYEKATGGS